MLRQLILITLTACTLLHLCVHAKPVHQGSTKNTDWDYFVFTQVWLDAECHVANFHQPGSCVVPKGVNDWTIHGLWPSSYSQHEGPNDCDKSDHFQESLVTDIRSKLDVQWPNVIAGESPTSFWEHEWTKHGTCAKSLAATEGEHNYFSTSLDLNEKFSIKKILQQSGIEPSKDKTYKLAEITQAIEKAVNAKIELHCLHINENDQHTYYFMDMRMCLDKSLKAIDCTQTAKPNRFLNLFLKGSGNKNQHGDPIPTPEICPSDKPLYYMLANS